MALSELEVPALLAPRVSPVAFEPAVPLQVEAAAKPPSSDHSVNLPSGEIFIEATTIDLRNRPSDSETILKRISGKLKKKRRQAVRDRVYLLALKVLGPPQILELVRQVILLIVCGLTSGSGVTAESSPLRRRLENLVFFEEYGCQTRHL